MKNNTGWTSEYRRKKFEKRYKNDKGSGVFVPLDPPPLLRFPALPKTIAVMLDIEGTCDGIEDATAESFIRDLDLIRKKFGAEYGTISLSTHGNSRIMKKVLDILSRNLSDNIRIGTNFFYGGIYDYATGRETTVNPNFNLDKVHTFIDYCVNATGIENVWFGLIDDNIQDMLNQLDNNHPMLLGKPSSSQNDLRKNSFNKIATTTKGFAGVVEIMDTYVKSIEKMTSSEIKESQKNSMTHLSSYDLVTKITNEEYGFLKRYFEEGYADDDDYTTALDWLMMLNRDKIMTEEELEELTEILSIIIIHFRKKGLKVQEEKTVAFQNLLTHK